MSYLFERCGGDCFIIADSRTGQAGVLTFDACGWDGEMSTEDLTVRVRGIRLAPRSYTAMDAYSELQATRHYAEMHATGLSDAQRDAWRLDPIQEC
jgi:hypothetical protein